METAYSCVNKLKLKTMIANGNKRAEKVLQLAENFDSLISTILVGNNIVNITNTSIAGLLFASMILDTGLAATVSTVVTTVAVLIFGEITPKMLAKVYPEKFAMSGYPLLKFFSYILWPINMIFTGYKFVLSKIFKLKNEEVVTEDEIITMVEEAREDGTLKQDESKLIRSVIDFDDLEAGDILIPRVNITAISVDTPFDEIMETFRSTGFSRLPVYKDTVDTICGILHEKDFFFAYLNKEKDLQSVLHEVTYTTEHVKIGALLKQLQSKKSHMAIVLDEYGGTLENRMRFMDMCLGEALTAARDDMAVVVKTNMRDGFRGGLDLDECLEVARRIERNGAHALVLSGGFVSRAPMYVMRGSMPLRSMTYYMKQLWLKAGVRAVGRWMIPDEPFREAYFLDDALRFREALKLPLVYVGGLVSRTKIDEVLGRGFEFVAMARALIREPDFVNRMKETGEERCDCDHTNYCIARMYSREMACYRNVPDLPPCLKREIERKTKRP